MRNEVCQFLRDALASLVNEGVLPDGLEVDVQVERSRGPEHGDFASNLAMVLATVSYTHLTLPTKRIV